MATMNVSLPDPMKTWVEEQVATGRYANASDYVRDLIRRHQQLEEKRTRLDAEIRKGDESADSPHTVMEVFEQVLERKRGRRNG